jgi:hypothetical protein
MAIRGKEALIELLQHPNFPAYPRDRMIRALSLGEEQLRVHNCASIARYTWGHTNDLELNTPEKRRELMHFAENTLALPDTKITSFPQPGCLVVFSGELPNEHYAINLNPMGSSCFSLHGIGGEFGIDNMQEIEEIYKHVGVRNRWDSRTYLLNLRPL